MTLPPLPPAMPPRRRALLQAGSLVLSLGAHQIAFGATIVAVRLWPAEDYTRVTIESDTALKADYQLISTPPRLAVDIHGLTLSPTLRELVAKVRSDDPNIAGIRVGQNSPTIVRLVIDLKHDIKPQVFTLTPVAAYRHRLVFDLYPATPPDPLAQLIAGRLGEASPLPPTETAAPLPPLASAPPSTAATPDTLGDLIAQQIERANRAVQPPTVATAPKPAPVPMTPRPDRPGRNAQRLIVIALDPGHGGEDPGAIGPGGTREKDVVLRIALKLGQRINGASVGGNPMRAFLTRDADYFVPLATRVEKARRVGADLFISIHADAFMRAEARGASVYVLSERGASSTAARWLADKENKADSVGGVNLGVQDRQIRSVLLDMSTSAQIRHSLTLGSAMLRQIGHIGRLHKSNVERANFAVLRSPDVPSILVETAFISNPEEERKLRSDSYQNSLADALFHGIHKYFAAHPPLPRNRPT